MKQMLLLTLTSHPNAADSFVRKVRRRAARVRLDLLAAFALWRCRLRTRHHLSGLDDRLLADIGLNRTQQRVECAKAPWQL